MLPFPIIITQDIQLVNMADVYADNVPSVGVETKTFIGLICAKSYVARVTSTSLQPYYCRFLIPPRVVYLPQPNFFGGNFQKIAFTLKRKPGNCVSSISDRHTGPIQVSSIPHCNSCLCLGKPKY